jgi:hypothetical protein
MAILQNVSTYSTQLGALEILPTILSNFYTIRGPETPPNPFSTYSTQLGNWPSFQNFTPFFTQLLAIALLPTLLTIFYTIRGTGNTPKNSHLFLHK